MTDGRSVGIMRYDIDEEAVQGEESFCVRICRDFLKAATYVYDDFGIPYSQEPVETTIGLALIATDVEGVFKRAGIISAIENWYEGFQKTIVKII
jgi:hypothetical protein